MERLQYPYRPSWKLIVGVTALFGACLVFFIHQTVTNDRGVIINHAIELGPQGATIFYGVLAFFSGVFVVAGLFMAVARTRFEHRLVIDEQGVELPSKAWKAEHMRVAFSDIGDVRHMVMNGSHWIAVTHQNGKLNIDGNRLPSKADFEIVMRTLVDRVERARRS